MVDIHLGLLLDVLVAIAKIASESHLSIPTK